MNNRLKEFGLKGGLVFLLSVTFVDVAGGVVVSGLEGECGEEISVSFRPKGLTHNQVSNSAAGDVAGGVVVSGLEGECGEEISVSFRPKGLTHNQVSNSAAGDVAGGVVVSGLEGDSVVKELKGVEVKAKRVKGDTKSAAPVFTLSDKDMKRMGLTSFADALHRLPGINLKDYGGIGGLKTVSVRGAGPTHTGVIYDGVSLSDCQSGRIDLSRYSLENVGTLQMVVGDHDDIFQPAKSATSSASIVISSFALPRFGDTGIHVDSSLGLGSFTTVNPFIRIGKGIGEDFVISAIGNYLYSKNDYPFRLKNGTTYTRERRTNSSLSSGNAELNMGVRLGEGETLTGKLYFYDNDRKLPGQVVLYNSDNRERLRTSNIFGQVAYRSLSSSRWNYQSIVKFNWDASRYVDEDGQYPGGILREDYWQREFYLSNALLLNAGKGVSLDYSVDYAYNTLNSNQENIRGPWRHTLLQTGAVKWQTSRLKVLGKLLWALYFNGVEQGESAKDLNKLSPSVSVNWKVLESIPVYVRSGYKNIYRVPTFNESYYFRVGNFALRPENSEQFNFGATWQLGSSKGWLENMSVSTDAFYNHVTDKIVALPVNMYVWRMVNIDKVRAYGVDATFNADVRLSGSQVIALSGNYSYQRVQPRTNPSSSDYNKQVAYLPVNSGAASVGWENPWVNTIFRMSAEGERFGTNTNYPSTRLRPYLDCGLSFQKRIPLGEGSMNLRFDISNLFDMQYEVVVLYPMPGRAFKTTIEWSI